MKIPIRRPVLRKWKWSLSMLVTSLLPALSIAGWDLYGPFLTCKLCEVKVQRANVMSIELLLNELIIIIIPILIAFLINLILPVGINFFRSLLFAIPASATYLLLYGISTFFVLDPHSIESFGFQVINTIVFYIPISLVIEVCTASGAYLGTRVRVKLAQSPKPTNQY